ncbi:hypothetical protein ACFQ60_20415 [Streptomyces zhihengii]
MRMFRLRRLSVPAALVVLAAAAGAAAPRWPTTGTTDTAGAEVRTGPRPRRSPRRARGAR